MIRVLPPRYGNDGAAGQAKWLSAAQPFKIDLRQVLLTVVMSLLARCAM